MVDVGDNTKITGRVGAHSADSITDNQAGKVRGREFLQKKIQRYLAIPLDGICKNSRSQYQLVTNNLKR